MKFQKEYLIFAVVAIAFIALVIFAVSSSGKGYKDFASTHETADQSMQTPTPEPTPRPTQPPPTQTVRPTDPPVATSYVEPTESGEPVESEPGEDDGNGDDNPEESLNSEADPDEGDRPSAHPVTEDYAYMMMYYVCGLEDEMFNQWMTVELRAAFRRHLTEEPYSALNGNTSFSNVQISDGHFSFTAKDGKTYAFDVEFDGDLVSGIVYVAPQEG